MILARFAAIMTGAAVLGLANADIWYRYHRIGPPWCQECEERADAVAINNLGQVCGRLDLRYLIHLASVWQPETDTLVDLGSLAACELPGAVVRDINDVGHLVGNDAGTGCRSEAWLWTPAAGMIGLGYPPGADASMAVAINSLGDIAGNSHRTDVGGNAFLWIPSSGMTALEQWPDELGSDAHDINDDRWIVGRTHFRFGSQCFLWTPEAGKQRLADLMGGDFEPIAAVGVNNRGQIIGRMASESLGLFAYIWDAENGMRDIGRPGPPETTSAEPRAMNNLGAVVGVAYVGGEPDFPFVWDAARGFRRLDTRLDPCTPTYLRRLRVATGINDHGQIIVNPYRDGMYAVLLTPYIAGDLNQDAAVALDDLAGLLANFGRTGDAAYEDGDLDCDADVDLQDLTTLLANFGDSHP